MEKILFFIVVYIVVNFQKIILNNHKYKKRVWKMKCELEIPELNILRFALLFKYKIFSLKYECIFIRGLSFAFFCQVGVFFENNKF